MKKLFTLIAIAVLFTACKKEEQKELGYKYVSYSNTGHRFFDGFDYVFKKGNERNETKLYHYDKDASVNVEALPSGKDAVTLEVYKNGGLIFKGNSGTRVTYKFVVD